MIISSISYPKPSINATINWGHPVTRKLDHCYLFNEARGNIIHNLAKNGKTASIVGSPPYWTFDSRFGSVLIGDGASIYINTNDFFWDRANMENIGGFSFEVWIYHLPLTGIDIMGSDNNIEWFLSSCYAGAATDLAFSTPNQYVWNHLVLTGGSMQGGKRIYINSVLDASDTNAHYGDGGTNPLRIGGGVSNGIANWFTGKISLARAWKRELTISEVRYLYREPYAMFRSNNASVRYYVPPAVAGGDELWPVMTGSNFWGPTAF